MGRIIAFDTGVLNSLDKILDYKHAQTCLIIGQHTVQRDVVVHLCPVPPKEKPSEQSSDVDDSGATQENQPPKSKQPKKPDDELELDDLWICHFSKEVTRTLAGGFEVLGLFIVAPSDTMSRLQQKFRQVLFAVFKVLSKDQELSICKDVQDRVLLHLCTVSKKFVCRTYDVSNTKSTPNPAEWKQLPSMPKWVSLQSHLAVDLKFAVSGEDNTSNVKKHIDSALSPFFKNILTAEPVINGCLREQGELLIFCGDGKKSKQKPVSHEQNFIIDLLIPMVQNENKHSKTSSCGMMLTFKGTIHCRAFVHPKATVQEAVQAIKQDIIRSITARSEIHCEDLLVIDEEQQDPVVVYELPKRVFAPLNQSGIQVCDYQFHGDTASDSLTAFKELLDLDLNEEDIETCELAPATSDLIQPEVMEDRLSEFGDTPPPKKSVLFPVASAAVAAFAAGLSYLLFAHDT